MSKRTLKGYFKAYDKASDLIEFVASTDTVDREGESIDPNGWDLSNVGKNLPLLWAHEDRNLPIGKVVSARIDGNQLVTAVEFAHKINDFAKSVYDMVVGGFLNAVSVGFLPKAYSGDGKMVSQELLELSVVNIPANPDAARAEAFRNFQKSLGDKAEWTTAYVNNLPDMAFAAIAPGGTKDETGRTVPRSLRALPHHNDSVKSPTENSSVDIPHLRNALARVDQTDLPGDLKTKARNHLERHAQALGVGDAGKALTKSPECRMPDETKDQCVARKIPQILQDNPGMANDQAVAIAEKMCSVQCGPDNMPMKTDDTKPLAIEEQHRNVARIAIEGMKQATDALSTLLNDTTPPAKKGGGPKPVEPVNGSRDARVLKLVRLMDKVGEAAIREIKNGGDSHA